MDLGLTSPCSSLPSPCKANLLCSARARRSVTGRQKAISVGGFRTVWLPQLPGSTRALDFAG